MGKYDAKKKTTRSKSRQKDDDLERSYAALYGSKKKKKENSNALSIALCVLAVVLILGLVFAAGKLEILGFEAVDSGPWVQVNELGQAIPHRYAMWQDAGYSDHLPVACRVGF